MLHNQVQLNLLLVLHRLAEESRIKAFEEKMATIKVHHVKAVAKVSSLVLLIKFLFPTKRCATKRRKSLIIYDLEIYIQEQIFTSLNFSLVQCLLLLLLC